jgi:hypothetical protein
MAGLRQPPAGSKGCLISVAGMSDPNGSNASGSQAGDSATTDEVVDSGQSEDIENSLTGQGISDRETTDDL